MYGSLAAVTLFAMPQDPPKMETIQLVVLRTGPTRLATEERDNLQANHLKFLEGLWKEGKALAVGPLEGAGEMRGLAFLDVKTPDEAKALMADDPLVKQGALALDCHTLWTMKSVIKKAPKFMKLQKFWFGLLVRPEGAPTYSPEESKKIQEGHMANIRAMAASGDLVMAGPFAEDTAWRGIFVFMTPDRGRVEALAAEDAAIKAGRLKLELYGWWTAKGTFEAFKE